MKLINVIASKDRPDSLSAKTLSWLCFSQHPYKVFVEPQDYQKYLAVAGADDLIKLPKNNQGLGYVKSYIAGWLKKQSYDLAFKLDDDIWGFVERGGRKDPETRAQLFDRAIDDSIKMFEKYPDVVGVGFPYRFELWEIKQWTGINARLQTAYIVRKDYFVGDPKISAFEDFHNYIYIRAKNKLTLRYGLVGIDNDVGEQPGGLQNFDRRKMAEAEVPLLRELYPALRFKKVKRAWGIEPDLSGAWFGTKKL